MFVFNQFSIRGPVAWLLSCPFEKSSFLLCLLVVDVWTKWKWLECVGGWINALISVRSHGNQGQELSFIDFIPMTSKQKSPFLRVIKRCSPYPYLRKNAHVASFFSSAASAAHVEHGCTCCQCIISTYRKHVCYLPQKTPMLWKSWLISCFYLKCLSILTSLKNFYCHVGPNSNLSVLLSDMLQWQWAEALWQFVFYAR